MRINYLKLIRSKYHYKIVEGSARIKLDGFYSIMQENELSNAYIVHDSFAWADTFNEENDIFTFYLSDIMEIIDEGILEIL